MKKIFATIALSSFFLTPAVEATPTLPTGDPVYSATSQLRNISNTIRLLRGSAIPKKLANAPQKIPQISHSIWLPRHPSSSPGHHSIGMLREKLDLLSKDFFPWRHIFWTTRSFEKIKDLTDLPIEINFIEDHAFISLPTVTRLMNHQCVGAAVDLLRYDIMERFGGFYSDLDYRIIKSPSFLFQSEFIAGFDAPTLELIAIQRLFTTENYMMAAVPHHKIFKARVPTLITLLNEDALCAYGKKRALRLDEKAKACQNDPSANLNFLTSYLADDITTKVFGSMWSLLSEKDSYHLLSASNYGTFAGLSLVNMNRKLLRDEYASSSLYFCSAFSFGYDTKEAGFSWL